MLVACDDALLYVGHDEGVHKVPLTLVWTVTLSGGASEKVLI